MSLLLALAALLGSATAGSGPWALGHHDYSLFLGAEAQRFDTLALSSGSNADDVVDVAGGISTLGVKAIVSYGLLPRIETELAVPWYQVHQNRPDQEPCLALGPGSCATTQGIGVVRMRVKGVAVDQILGAPVTLALGPELRLGQHTAQHRERLTNLGEGTFDAGGFLAVGRTGGLGGGYWSGFLELAGRYRSPNTDLYTGAAGKEEKRVPGAEYQADLEALFSPDYDVAFGPSVGALWRPEGFDFEDSDLTDTDRLSGLKIFTVQAGAKVLVRGGDEVTVSAAVLRTVYAVNNPSDTWTVSLGLSARGFLDRERG